jgi:hypothetical protein
MKAKARLTIGGGRDFDNGRVSYSKLATSAFPATVALSWYFLTRFRFRPRQNGGGISNYHLVLLFEIFLGNR